jgi:hypothetical protein
MLNPIPPRWELTVSQSGQPINRSMPNRIKAMVTTVIHNIIVLFDGGRRAICAIFKKNLGFM